MTAERIPAVVHLDEDPRAVTLEPVAYVSRILPFSCVDGPGNRLVIFLQGCNFNCVSCHNPHTINTCHHCAECVSECPAGALTLGGDGKVHWQPSLCTDCDRCIDVCNDQSSPKIARVSVTELLAMLLPRAAFIRGVTVSGGEATMQLRFVIALFKAIKSTPALRHLSCFIDSNGQLAERGWQALMPYLDGAMIDIKAWDEQVHRQLTGRSNRQVLRSISYLAAANALAEVRILHIPHYSDFEREQVNVGAWLASLPSAVTIRLNGFRQHGVRGQARHWPECTPAQIRQLRQALIRHSGREIPPPLQA
ncbi:YjjW family glycine radical enzyme activase [Shewanella sp. NIFS-20-20]|uniref:YjjW family glycine radical enzyme activase n=1 Tax=Shewanella sp. NIFS-20-20 TaxID=2853806 RepID=UPI001C48480C|nr:YjjW family glycine radical enzyme activase [Shewanella sp. NIFS-20-20]MBV7316527.1 YjjW family glycine radical enzyme activase [Shewanella sp. NIFS-20-20]